MSDGPLSSNLVTRLREIKPRMGSSGEIFPADFATIDEAADEMESMLQIIATIAHNPDCSSASCGAACQEYLGERVPEVETESKPVATPGATVSGEDSVAASSESSRPPELLARAAGWLAAPDGETKASTTALVQSLVAEIKRQRGISRGTEPHYAVAPWCGHLGPGSCTCRRLKGHEGKHGCHYEGRLIEWGFGLSSQQETGE
jgi:hypothetical protein